MRKKNMIKIIEGFLFQKSLNQIRILIWSLESATIFQKVLNVLKSLGNNFFL